MNESLEKLVKQLREEASYVQSEKKHLIELYKQVIKKSEHLFHKQWSIGRQQIILDDLIFCRSSKLSPAQICYKYSALNSSQVQFTESHKLLGHNDYHVAHFYRQLRNNPRHLAALLVISEKCCTQMAVAQLVSGIENQTFFSNQILIPIVFQSVYGNCVLNEDEIMCLQLLKNLIEMQFSSINELTNIDLRRLIRKPSCSFNILFRFYTSFAFSNQLFLYTSLHEPITQVLTDEWYLDVDPEKALGRFSNEELISRFGQPNTKEYKLKTLKYREKIVNQLYSITQLFIETIAAHIFCFPQSLTWLVNQLYNTVARNFNPNNQNSQQDLARKLCCDLIMALYICPAICDPEPYGIISHIQITPVARHNLMQIANILQFLAMSDEEKSKETKAYDLYSKFQNNCVSEILNSLIWPRPMPNGTDSINDLNNMFAMPCIEASLLSRISMMITLSDLHKLIIFAWKLSKDPNQNQNTSLLTDEFRDWLKKIVPSDYIAQVLNSNETSEVISNLMKEADGLAGWEVLVMNINENSYDCPGMMSEEKVLKEYEASLRMTSGTSCQKVSYHHHHHHHRISKHGGYGSRNQLTLKRRQANNEDSDILDSSFEPTLNQSTDSVPVPPKLHSHFDLDLHSNITYEEEDGDVDVANSISSSDDEETNDRVNIKTQDINQILDDIDDANQLERLREGLSDLDVFSGRDTPITSGRDTPSSYSQSDINGLGISKTPNKPGTGRNDSNLLPNSNSNADASQVLMPGGSDRGPQLPVTVRKANREDINDKFCKFEINKTCNLPLKEEQMSEAWSLDADAPESIINDPLLDENTSLANLSIASSMNQNGQNNNSLNSFSNSRTNSHNNISGSQINNGSSRLISNPNSNNSLINSFQPTAYASTINQTLISDQSITNSGILPQPSSITALGATSRGVLLTRGATIEAATVAALDPLPFDNNDCFSTVSGSTAWSTEPANNSDSDLECNSPSKYTPYSTYSSVNSSQNQHPSINQSFFFQSNSSLNTQQQQTTSHVTSPLSGNLGVDLIKSVPKSLDTGVGIWNLDAKPVSTNEQPIVNQTKKSTTQPPPPQQQPQLPKRNSFQRLFNTGNKQASVSNPQLPNSSSATSLSQAGSPAEAQPTKVSNPADNIENILKKYSNKTSVSSTQSASQLTVSAPVINEGILIDLSVPSDSNVPSPPLFLPEKPLYPPTISANTSFENTKQFLDAKKKLRIVFSWPECFSLVPLSNNSQIHKENFLKMHLQSQFYEAISLQDTEKQAQLRETIRCISGFADHECYKLLRALKKDYQRRICYITYLTRSKQNILYCLNLIEKLLQRTRWHQSLRCTHLASTLTRLFLESADQDAQLNAFTAQFRQLPSIDEKFDLYRSYTAQLKATIKPIWANCQLEIMELGNINLERLVITRVYRSAMFPNGEVDQFRDTKVQECFSELASVITPSHPLIGIPAIYENECPWIAAQEELSRLNVFKTPRDKLDCVKKCLLTIQNLLGLAKSPVCADDLHPVLIYVIIKANVAGFLSNVQFIEGYYGSQLESEDYYWAQFMFAFSYIKAKMIGNKV